jgi:RES domain-containing protein
LRVFTLELPEGEVRWIYPELLPDEWAEPTALPLTQMIFSEWLQHPSDMGVGVPSAVVDLSYNVLLHPRHPLYSTIIVVGEQDLMVDRRLWSAPNP